MEVNTILNNFETHKESSLKGRYVTLKDIEPLLEPLKNFCEVTKEGISENGLPIYLIKLGKGPKKLLWWSQMHGNESTTTKAVFDVLNFLKQPNETASKILEECTLYILPMLNPDGALLYTRANFNNVDLNRDAQERTQKESKLFKQIVDKVQPLVAFNLHGQRTIFSAGHTNNSAIVSFLSPASDEERSITPSRKKGMHIIAQMNNVLQQTIPNCVGRYDDGFNINCTGDTMEASGYTTILFEAGHHPNDYDREITRKWIYLSLITALNTISLNGVKEEQYMDYFDIPENEKLFKDIVVRNLPLENSKYDVSIQYKEQLINNTLQFIPEIMEISSQITDYGHIEFNSDDVEIKIYNVLGEMKKGALVEYLRVFNEKFSVFPIKK